MPTETSLPRYSVTNLIASLLLISVLAVTGFFVFKIIQFENMSKIERLNDLWRRDVHFLQKTKHLHKGWQSIASIEAFAGSPKAEAWLKDLKVPTQKVRGGKYTLEVLLLEFTEEGVDHAVIQLNMVELKSGNMIWELARTYKLNSYFE